MDFSGTPSKSLEEQQERLAKLGKLSDLEKNPCYVESQLSYRCMHDNSFDRDQCSNAFQNYKNCRKFWDCVTRQRASNGERPVLPPINERDAVKIEYRRKCAVKFLSYDFRSDIRFVTGWNQLTSAASLDTTSESADLVNTYLTAKIYYYTRTLHQLTEEEQQDLRTDVWTAYEGVGETTSVRTCEDNSKALSYPASIQEVMGYIQRGEPVPGADDITVEPTNEIATASKLTKPLKPWVDNSS